MLPLVWCFITMVSAVDVARGAWRDASTKVYVVHGSATEQFQLESGFYELYKVLNFGVTSQQWRHISGESAKGMSSSGNVLYEFVGFSSWRCLQRALGPSLNFFYWMGLKVSRNTVWVSNSNVAMAWISENRKKVSVCITFVNQLQYYLTQAWNGLNIFSHQNEWEVILWTITFLGCLWR